MITIRYADDTAERVYPHTPTIGEIKADRELRAELGFGESVKARINGIEMPDETPIPEGATVVLETRANVKGVKVIVKKS